MWYTLYSTPFQGHGEPRRDAGHGAELGPAAEVPDEAAGEGGRGEGQASGGGTSQVEELYIVKSGIDKFLNSISM